MTYQLILNQAFQYYIAFKLLRKFLLNATISLLVPTSLSESSESAEILLSAVLRLSTVYQKIVH